jgi:hypothetical protein
MDQGAISILEIEATVQRVEVLDKKVKELSLHYWYSDLGLRRIEKIIQPGLVFSRICWWIHKLVKTGRSSNRSSQTKRLKVSFVSGDQRG